MLRRILTLSAFGVVASLASQVNAQSTASTVTAPNKGVISGVTANVDVRAYGERSRASSAKSQYLRSQQVRFNLGSKLLNEKIEAELTLGAIRQESSTTLLQRRPELEAQLLTITSTYASLFPFINAKAPFEGSGTDVKLGARPKFTTTPISTVVGSVEGFAEAEVYANFSTKPRAVKVDNADETTATDFGLSRTNSSDGTTTYATTEDGFSGTAEYRAGARYIPSVLDNALSIEVSSMFGQEFVRSATIEDSGLAQESGVVEYSEAKGVVSYQVNPALSVRNETVAKWNGYYSADWAGDAKDPRFTNLTGVKYTLF